MDDHPISIKFGTQQHVWNSVTVTRPNVIFKNLRCRTRTATIKKKILAIPQQPS